MKILIQNGHVLDPESKTEGIYDILVEEKKIVKVASQNSLSHQSPYLLHL